jgi:hypothetical protein
MGAAGFGVAHEVQSIRHDNGLIGKLEQPQETVAKEIKTGQIDPDDITLVRAPESGLAFDVATDIVGNDHDPRQVSDILSYQTNGTNQVVEGQKFELPKNEVPSDSPYIVMQK